MDCQTKNEIMNTIVAYQNSFSTVLFDDKRKNAFKLAYAIFKDPCLNPNKIVAKWTIRPKQSPSI